MFYVLREIKQIQFETILNKHMGENKSVNSQNPNQSNDMELAHKPGLHDADKTIRLALFFQVGLAVGIFFLYIFLRKRLPWIYYTNTKSCKTHPASSYKGYLSWAIPIFNIHDTVFFDLVGFDAFLFVETLKLFGIVFLVLSAFLFPGLSAYYYYFAKSDEVLQFITKISFLSLEPHPRYANCIVPCIAVWIITITIFYFLYIFFRKYVILRQLHIRNRVFSNSTPSIKKRINQIKSFDSALDEINICSRTVLITNIPKFIKNKKDLLFYLKVLGIKKEPENMHLVGGIKSLEKLVQKKKEAVLDLELALQKFFIRLNFLSTETDFFKNNVDNYDPSLDLISNAIEWKKACTLTKEQYAEELDPLVEKAISGEFFNILQKINPNCSSLDIDRRIEKIQKLTEKINIERKNAAKEEVSDETALKTSSNSQLHDRYNIDENESIFISTLSIINLKQAYESLINSFPLGAHNAFVTFETTSDANFLRLALLGSGTFSCKAIEAPSPDQITWSTLTDSRMKCLIRETIGAVLTFIFVSIFILIVFFVSAIINIDTFDSIVARINPELHVFTKKSSFKKTFQGIIVPSVYSLFLSIAPTILHLICILEGSISTIAYQKKFEMKYSIFLFFNAFLVLIFGTSIAGLIYEKEPFKWTFVHIVSTPLVSSSIFFLIVLIQKTFSGLAIILLELPSLVSWGVDYFLGGMSTRREEILKFEPLPVNFGLLYPQIFLLFPMVLIYSVICPLFIPIGCLYFFGSFFVYKSLFIYSHVSLLESGGEHWPLLFKNIFYCLSIFQTITLLYFVSHKQYVSLLIILPLLAITFGIWKGFSKVIMKNCYFLPNNNSETEESSISIKKIFETRKKSILQWKQSSCIEKDVYFIHKEDSIKDGVGYIYRDLSFLPAASAIILPNWFYLTLQYLKANGDSSVFDLKPNGFSLI